MPKKRTSHHNGHGNLLGSKKKMMRREKNLWPVWHAHLSPRGLHVSQYLWSFEDSRAWSEQALRYRGAAQPHENKQEGLHWYSKYWYWPVGVLVCFKDIVREFYMDAAIKESSLLASTSPSTLYPSTAAYLSLALSCLVFQSAPCAPPDSLQQRDAWKLNQSAALPQSFLLFVEEPGGGSQWSQSGLH